MASVTNNGKRHGENAYVEILTITAALDLQKKILKTANIEKLPDKGERVKQKIKDLETQLENMTLCAKEEHSDDKSINAVPIENKCEINPVRKHDKNGEVEIRKKKSSDGQNFNIKSFQVKESDMLSFEHLSKGVLKVADPLKDLVSSPSFTTRRDPGITSKIKLTEAKPLFEEMRKKNFTDGYSSAVPTSLPSDENVKKLHSALGTYPDNSPIVEQPTSLKTSLLPHQIEALSWLIWRESQPISGGILADDMGLGKTLTMISLILKQKENNNFLVEKSKLHSSGTLIICLASILHQWKDEIEKHCDNKVLKVLLYHGIKREKDPLIMKENNIVLTTYHILMSEYKAMVKGNVKSGLFELKWERIILDEAHTIKNHNTQTALAVFGLKSFRKWSVTGTPIHNEFKDMYSLVKFLQFAPFDDYKYWKKLVNEDSPATDKRRNLLVKSILLRRTKQEADDSGKPIVKMAKKSLTLHKIELSEAEQNVYDNLSIKINDALMKQFRKKSCGLNTSSMLLVLLLRLQQCCNHVSLLNKETEDSTWETESTNNDSMNELSVGLSSLDIKENLTSESNCNSSDSGLDMTFSEYTEKVDLSDPMVQSTKIRNLFERLDEIRVTSDNKDKSVIVSQWVSMLNVVTLHLKEKGIAYHMISGKSKPEDRQKDADDFNNNEKGCKIMLLSLKAGGVGLNLVGANHLFLLDLHWNPALEQQACDRIHRVGQVKDVTIHKFVCKNTIEEKILELQKRKSSLASGVLHGKKHVKGISMEDFKELFNIKV